MIYLFLVLIHTSEDLSIGATDVVLFKDETGGGTKTIGGKQNVSHFNEAIT